MGGGGGLSGRGLRELNFEISRFTGIETDFSRNTHHSAFALIFNPYGTIQLTCRPF